MTIQKAQAHYVPRWTLGDRLRRIRRDNNLSQPAFAESIGVKAKRYAAWEVGPNSPRADELLRIARVIEETYGVPAAWTLDLPHGPKDAPVSGGITLAPTPGSMTTQRYPHLAAA